VLAEIPEEWEQAVTGWRERAGSLDPNTDYLFWQTLVGAYSATTGPLPLDRMLAYLDKATKEAKERTSWTDPDEAFERSLHEHVEAVYADADLMSDIGQWVTAHLLDPGVSNSLAQKLVQLTMPGVPDVYQGQELTDLALVDPDNRRPVDFDTRRKAVEHLDAAEPKLQVTTAALHLRRARPAAFTGGYSPVAATGPAADNVLAFRRGDDVITLATRLPVSLTRSGGWRDTSIDLPAGNWRDVLTDEAVTSPRVDDILRRLPVALLVRDTEEVT
jgi:(1->4)-alpha-D-glucan 1-alpha-D-glucosylmutase